MLKGVWTSDQARQLFEYTKSAGGRIAASEFMNEPTYAAMGGAPKGYDAASYGRDGCGLPYVPSEKLRPIHYFSVQVQLARDRSQCRWATGVLKSEELLHAAGPVFDVFFVPSLCGCFAAVRKHGRIITNNGGSGTFSRLALATGKDWRILRGPSRQVRAWKITLDYRNGGCSLRRKPLGVDFSEHLPISCSTCKPRPAWRESDYAQHTGIKQLRPV